MRYLLTIGLLVALPAAAQQMYRCGSTFSQQPCGAGQQVIGSPPPSASAPVPDVPASPEIQDKARSQCLARLMQDVAFKDPESVRVRSVERRALAPITGTNQWARWYVITANAKNSHGGYTGDSPYLCFTDPKDETRVLLVRPAL